VTSPRDGGATDDPFVVLGLTRAASIADVRAARRRLAFDLHPDRGGDEVAMQTVNAAFEACIAHLTGRRPLADPAASGAPAPPAPPGAAPRARREPPPVQWGRRGSRPRIEYDAPSFTVDALPAETFEALLLVAGWIGEVLDDDPPYLLECHLHEPRPCWCRLDVVPDAGGSTVSITVATPAGEDLGTTDLTFVELVRDVWVEQLNQLGRPMP
jgi:hypothetical protein